MSRGKEGNSANHKILAGVEAKRRSGSDQTGGHKERRGPNPQESRRRNRAGKKLRSELGREPLEWSLLVAITLAAALVPLIVHLKVIPLSGNLRPFWYQSQNADFFSYYKSVWLQVLATCVMFMFMRWIYKRGFRNLRWSHYYTPIMVFGLLITLSAVRSKYPQVALSGFPDRYEGLWTLLAYLILLVATSNVVADARAVYVVLTGVMVNAAGIGLIGLFQGIGWDFLKSNLGKQLAFSASDFHYASQVQFKYPPHTIYATLYHSDYVGSYTALIFPLIFALFIFEKKQMRKLALGMLAALMAFVWLGSTSRAGMVGGVVAVLTLFLFSRRTIVRNAKYVAGAMMLLILLGGALNVATHGYLGKRVYSLWADASGIGSEKVSQEAVLPLKDVVVNGNEASVTTVDGNLNMSLDNGRLIFEDANRKSLAINFDESTGVIKILDPRYGPFQLKVGLLEKRQVLFLNDGRINLYFGVEGNRFSFLDYHGTEIQLKQPPTWGFSGQERIGSSRGYIWSRSIPLLKDTILVGHGPDTFAMYFPQYDIFGKMYAYYGDMWQLVDKPHDFYLQTAINTGVLSLLAVLGLFIMYLVGSIRLYWSHPLSDGVSRGGVAVFVGVLGYLVAALFNDSVVSVAPVFWVLLGLGIATNRMARRLAVETVDEQRR